MSRAHPPRLPNLDFRFGNILSSCVATFFRVHNPIPPPPPSWRHDRDVVYIMPIGAARSVDREPPCSLPQRPLRLPAEYPELPSMSPYKYLIHKALYAMTAAVG